MSEEYDAFLQDCMTRLPSSVPTTVEPELAMVLRDFLQQTSAWRQMFEMPVQKNHTCYVVKPMQGSAINLLHYLFEATDPDMKPVALGGYNMAVPGEIRLSHAPQADALWVADVSLYPTRNLTAPDSCRALVPSYILERYYDTLMNGVLGRMMRQLMKPYTNLQLGALHGAAYGAGRATAKADLARSNVWGGQQWSFPAATTARGRQVGA